MLMKKTNATTSNTYNNHQDESQKIINEKLKDGIKSIQFRNKEKINNEVKSYLLDKEKKVSKIFLKTKDPNNYYLNLIENSTTIDNTIMRVCHKMLSCTEIRTEVKISEGEIKIGEKYNLYELTKKPEDFEMKKRLAENCSMINNQINRLHDVNKIMKEINIPKKERFFMQYNLKNDADSTKANLIKRLRSENRERSKRILGRSVNKLKKLEDDEKNQLIQQEEQYKSSIKQKSLMSIEKYKVSKNRKKLGPMFDIQLASQSERMLDKKVIANSLDDKAVEEVQGYTPQIHFPVNFKKSNTYKVVQRAYKQRKEEEGKSVTEVRERIRKMRDYVGDLYLKENLPPVGGSPKRGSLDLDMESPRLVEVGKELQSKDNVLTENPVNEKVLIIQEPKNDSKIIEMTPKKQNSSKLISDSHEKIENKVEKKDETTPKKLNSSKLISDSHEKIGSKVEKKDEMTNSTFQTDRPASRKSVVLEPMDPNNIINTVAT